MEKPNVSGSLARPQLRMAGEARIPVVERRALRDCADLRASWSDLAARAVEPNPFFEPDFALAGAQHLVAFAGATAVLIWEDRRRERLLGFVPCHRRGWFALSEAWQGFSDRRVLNGAPLLDAREGQAAMAALLAAPGIERLVLGRVDLDGALVAALRSWAPEAGFGLALAADASAPRREARQPAAGNGHITVEEARSRPELRDMVEIILALEASGERARAGLAMLQDTREAGFLRAMTRSLGRSRQCRAALLLLDGRPIAGALTIGRAKRSWLYALVEDEAQAILAPGDMLLAALARKPGTHGPILPEARMTGVEAGPRPGSATLTRRVIPASARLGRIIGRRIAVTPRRAGAV